MVGASKWLQSMLITIKTLDPFSSLISLASNIKHAMEEKQRDTSYPGKPRQKAHVFTLRDVSYLGKLRQKAHVSMLLLYCQNGQLLLMHTSCVSALGRELQVPLPLPASACPL